MTAGRLVTVPRGMVRSLSGQLALLTGIAVAPVAAGLVILSVLMLFADHAVVLVAAILAGAAVLAILGTHLVSRSIVGDLESLRAGLQAVGDGARDVTIESSANDELARVAEAANRMIERLTAEEAGRARSEAARRDLVVAVSHDLRTPMTSLRLIADAVGDDLVEGEQRRVYLDRMRTHIDALSALVDDLFELSRLQAGDIGWTLEQVRLAELVDETVEAMRVHAEAKRIDVRTEMPLPLSARANPEKLQRVLFNLIQNAIRHTPADGSIVVHGQALDRRIELEIADTGAGIPAAERERVFEAFQRGSFGEPRTDGAGLGLAVSRAIVEAHGGRIWIVDSTRGARVRFSLPADGS